MTEEQVLQMKPLVQAYIGDCVYELYVREHLLAGQYGDVNRLHKKAIRYVKAQAQARILYALEPELTPREADVARRGRNAHVHTVPKNAEIADYHAATGFEALIGYLHLTEQRERLAHILRRATEIGEAEIGEERNGNG